MKYREVGNKFVITKANGTNFAVTPEERKELRALLDDMDSGEHKYLVADSRRPLIIEKETK